MEDIEGILAKIGLTNQESRVYLMLLKLNQTQTGILCKKTGIARSNIYTVLEGLIGKGLASYKIKNNIKIFMPSGPDMLNDLFIEKQEKLDQEREEINRIVEKLKEDKVGKEHGSDYRYFEGFRGVKSMWHEINEQLKRGHLFKGYTCKFESGERLLGVYDKHHDIRALKRVKARLIFPKNTEALAEKRRKQLAEVKFMNLTNDSEWGVFGDYLYMLYISEKIPRAFLVKDKIFVKTFEQTFDQLWSIAKK
jgi:HTH-type transcriptional regulator, sugar sensing transcriptional regulator